MNLWQQDTKESKLDEEKHKFSGDNMFQHTSALRLGECVQKSTKQMSGLNENKEERLGLKFTLVSISQAESMIIKGS